MLHQARPITVHSARPIHVSVQFMHPPHQVGAAILHPVVHAHAHAHTHTFSRKSSLPCDTKRKEPFDQAPVKLNRKPPPEAPGGAKQGFQGRLQKLLPAVEKAGGGDVWQAETGWGAVWAAEAVGGPYRHPKGGGGARHPALPTEITPQTGRRGRGGCRCIHSTASVPRIDNAHCPAKKPQPRPCNCSFFVMTSGGPPCGAAAGVASPDRALGIMGKRYWSQQNSTDQSDVCSSIEQYITNRAAPHSR